MFQVAVQCAHCAPRLRSSRGSMGSRYAAVQLAGDLLTWTCVCRGSLGHMQAASEKLQRNTARISDEQHLTELATLASAAAQVCVRAARQHMQSHLEHGL